MNDVIKNIKKNIAKVIVDKDDPVEKLLVTLLCQGHLLIEDVPGLGKTMLARSLAKSLNCETSRVQFTPDMLPSDVTGVSVYEQKSGSFRFVEGPVFTHLLLADEINRTSPRTQSALLEAMSEKQVSTDGITRMLPDLFMVIATQNPIEQTGTYPLPEAQLDRFFMKVAMGYPSVEAEIELISAQNEIHPINNLGSVANIEEILDLQKEVQKIVIKEEVKRYVVELCVATRNHELVKLGASPRGSLSLTKAAQGLALIRGQSYVEPTLIKELAVPVLAHRLILKPEARSKKLGAEEVIHSILASVSVPVC